MSFGGRGGGVLGFFLLFIVILINYSIVIEKIFYLLVILSLVNYPGSRGRQIVILLYVHTYFTRIDPYIDITYYVHTLHAPLPSFLRLCANRLFIDNYK